MNEEHVQLGLHRKSSVSGLRRLGVWVMTCSMGGHINALPADAVFLISFQHKVTEQHTHHVFSSHTHAGTHVDTSPLLTNDFLIPGQYPSCEANVREGDDDSITYEIQFPCGRTMALSEEIVETVGQNG